MSGFDWKIDLQRWVNAHRDISPQLTNSISIFFELAFKHTRCPQRAWFGIHSSAASLVVGGIYLAAIQRSGGDKGFWLLVDQHPPILNDVMYPQVKSTQKSTYPLVWAHAEPLAVLTDVITSESLWNSFSIASEKILASSIASDRDSVQEQRKKKRLSEFFYRKFNSRDEAQFQNAITSALRDKTEVRRKRLESARTIPKKVEVVSISFIRNPDVVAEVLFRANGYCEHCKNPAPFVRRIDNSPYLEVHHIKPLSEGGEDTVANAIALCPNCHRRAHHA